LADNERLPEKEFNLSENNKIPFDHFSAFNLNNNDTNLDSKYMLPLMIHGFFFRFLNIKKDFIFQIQQLIH